MIGNLIFGVTKKKGDKSILVLFVLVGRARVERDRTDFFS